MGKRQKRIFSTQLSAELPVLLSKQLQVVFKNNTTLSGALSSVQSQNIVVVDYFLKKHIVDIKEIEEIVIDFVSEY